MKLLKPQNMILHQKLCFKDDLNTHKKLQNDDDIVAIQYVVLYVQKNRLMKKKEYLTGMLTELREKLIISQEHSDILEMCGVPAAELFKRLCHKEKTYSPQLRAFALTLHFYSPKAYDNERDIFNTCLPHPGTLRKWYSSVHASPGFTEEAFRVLRNKFRDSDRKVI